MCIRDRGPGKKDHGGYAEERNKVESAQGSQGQDGKSDVETQDQDEILQRIFQGQEEADIDPGPGPGSDPGSHPEYKAGQDAPQQQGQQEYKQRRRRSEQSAGRFEPVKPRF